MEAVKTNVKYQLVPPGGILFPSDKEMIDVMYNRYDTELLRFKSEINPFKIAINDETLKNDDSDVLFNEYYFSYRDFPNRPSFITLITVDHKFVLLRRISPEQSPKFEIFFIDGFFIFDEVSTLVTPFSNERSYYFHLVISYIIDNGCTLREYRKSKKTTKVLRFTFSEEKGVNVEEAITPIDFEICNIFGPFPLHLNTEKQFDYRNLRNASWIALCSDDYYRVFYTGYKPLKWILHPKSNEIFAFKRFMPTLKPNYYYFLSKDNEELVVNMDFDCKQQIYDDALRSGANSRRLLPNEKPWYGKINIFLGKDQDQGFMILGKEPKERLPVLEDFTKNLFY